MAFFVKSVQNHVVQNTMKAVDQTVKQTANDTANLLYGQSEPEEKIYHQIKPDKQLLQKKDAKLMFRFGGGRDAGHWMVFIYELGAPNSKCTKCHYVGNGVHVAVCDAHYRHNGQWKDHKIKTRTYREIMKWCAGYHDANAEYMLLEANCRKFSIRLAEYCNVPITEMDVGVSSQYYSVAETVKGTTDGAKNIAKGNVIQGVTGIGGSVIKNTAKIAVASGSGIVDKTTDAVKAIANQ
eukprot:5784_1